MEALSHPGIGDGLSRQPKTPRQTASTARPLDISMSTGIFDSDDGKSVGYVPILASEYVFISGGCGLRFDASVPNILAAISAFRSRFRIVRISGGWRSCFSPVAEYDFGRCVLISFLATVVVAPL